MRFQTKTVNRRRSVLSDAYEAGHEAGRKFEYRRGIRDKAG
jgi:hypothetical protein